MFSFCVVCLSSCKHEAWQPCIHGVAKDWEHNFVPGLTKNDDWLNENLSHETIFQATTGEKYAKSASLRVNLYHLIEFHVNQNAYFLNLKNPFFPPTDITVTYLYRIVVTLLSQCILVTILFVFFGVVLTS